MPPVWQLTLAFALLALGSGCNSFGNGKLVQQLQLENERLLSEFRAEKARREQAEQKMASVELKLAESEKLLARQYQAGQFVPHLSSRPTGAPLPTPGKTDSPSTPAQGGAGDEGQSFRWQRRMT